LRAAPLDAKHKEIDMTASPWNTTLTTHELDAHYALTASIDPRFAREERAFYESRTLNQLKVLAAQAWDRCEPTAYQLARSHAAVIEPDRSAS
jgi:hypothetical protein